MAITSLEKVKTVLNIVGSEKDAQILAYIPLVEEAYLRIRNRAFDVDENGNTLYPSGSELTAISMIEFHLIGKPINGTAGSVSSESLSRYSVSYVPLESEYPKNIISSITRYVRFA